MGLVGLFPSCLRGYFVGPRFFLVQFFSRNFLSYSRRYFVGTIVFSRGYFVGVKILVEDISWAQFFFPAANFLIQKFSFLGTRKSDRK